MAKYSKILLLFVFVTAPAMDIAFLDAQESTDHYSDAYHDTVDYDQGATTDLHCVCHVIHHGISIDKVSALTKSDLQFKTRQVNSLVVSGLNPKPGLHPPSTILS